MRHFEVLTCNWSSGMIGEQGKEALEIAKLTNRRVVFDFNEVMITVRPTDSVEQIVQFYLRKRS